MINAYHISMALSRKVNVLLKSSLGKGVVASMVLVGLITAILYTYAPLASYRVLLNSISLISVLFFTAEYICRIIAAPASLGIKSRFKAVHKYIFSFFGIIDFISILPFIASMFADRHGVAEAIELARIFLVFKLIRYSKTIQLMADIFRSVKGEIFVALVSGSVILTFAAILMYYIERAAQPEVFSNIGQGFWWAVITFTTVGYGDIYPITPLGKLLGGFIAIIGIVTVALPTSIFTSSFMNRLQNERRRAENHSEDTCPHCGKKINDTNRPK